MRILVLSDLHHEHWREHAPRIDPALSRPDAVILAGDIDSGATAVQWAAQSFPGLPVLYVHGNHEGYGQNLEGAQADIRAACALTDNVHFLDCGEYIIGQVRFLGATLWTDFRLFGDEQRQVAMYEAEATMADYKRIRLAKKGYRTLRASDTAQFHARQKSWLRQKLAEPFAGKTVVITHMAPALQSVVERFSRDIVSAAYASHLEELVQQADLWIHGHMHDSSDYTLGRCRIVCNPRGYMRRSGAPENAGFDPNFIAELDVPINVPT